MRFNNVELFIDGAKVATATSITYDEPADAPDTLEILSLPINLKVELIGQDGVFDRDQGKAPPP